MDAAVFIGTVIVAIVEVIKAFAPKIGGWVTIVVAGLVGLIVALVDVNIGLPDVSIASGIMIGLSAAGVVATAKKVNTGTPKA